MSQVSELNTAHGKEISRPVFWFELRDNGNFRELSRVRPVESSFKCCIPYSWALESDPKVAYCGSFRCPIPLSRFIITGLTGLDFQLI